MKNVLCLIMCLSLGQQPLFSPLTLQSNDTNPFIYYYSFANSTFVVERADGSERKLLARFQLPDTHTWIEGAGWSPSGKWFSWTSAAPFGTSSPNMNVDIVSRDGSSHFSLLDEVGNRAIVRKAMWSPVQDLLLFSYTFVADTGDWVAQKIVVHDPITNRNLIEFENPHQGAHFLRVSWSPDGKSIAAFDGDVYLLTLENSDNDLIHISSQDDASEICSDFGSLPHWIDEKTIAYLHPQRPELTINNLSSQMLTSIDFPDGEITHVDWSSDAAYALVYLQPVSSDIDPQLWLTSLTGDKTLLANEVQFTNNCIAPFDESAWSQYDQAFFITSDGQLNIVSINKDHNSPELIPNLGRVLEFSPIRWSEDRLLFLTIVTGSSSEISSYSPETHATATILSETVSSRFFNPETGRLFYADSGLGIVVDSATDERVEIKFLADSKYGTIGVDKNIWHPDASWLFLTSTSIETVNLINIVRSDGTGQRQLSLCRPDSKTCFGWLPPIVDS